MKRDGEKMSLNVENNNIEENRLQIDRHYKRGWSRKIEMPSQWII